MGLVRAGLVLAVLIVYANSFGLGLALDGTMLVKVDPRIRAVTAENVRLVLTAPYWYGESLDLLYRPVTTLSMMADSAVLDAGGRPAIYHATNVLLHAFNVLLMFELARRLMQSLWPAAAAAALWAVHPVGTEAVANVAGRADLLSAGAVLGGLLLYSFAREWEGRRRWAGAAALFAIASFGVFSKENAAVLPAMLLLWDFTAGWDGMRGLLRRAPFYAASLASLVWMWAMRTIVFAHYPWPQQFWGDNPLRGADFVTARLTAIKVIGLDLWLMVWPSALASDRSYNAIPLSGFGDAAMWASLIVAALVVAAAIARYRDDRVPFCAVGFLALALLPTSNLIVTIGATMADRFLYLPAVGFTIALASLIWRMKVERRVTAGLLAAVGIAYAGRTIARNPDWNDEITLFSKDVQTEPMDYRLHQSVATMSFDADPSRNLDLAIREAEAAWKIVESLPPVRVPQQLPANLGIFYRLKGDQLGGTNSAEGRAFYERARAMLLRAREASQAWEKDYDEAQLRHGKPLGRRSANHDLYFQLCTTELGLGLFGEAADACRYSIALDPSQPNSYDMLANVQARSGDSRAAAVTQDEKLIAFGMTPASVAAIGGVYAQIDGGACALRKENGVEFVNPQCPVVREDFCRAAADLAGYYRTARDAQRGIEIAATAAKQYGCASQ